MKIKERLKIVKGKTKFKLVLPLTYLLALKHFLFYCLILKFYWSISNFKILSSLLRGFPLPSLLLVKI